MNGCSAQSKRLLRDLVDMSVRSGSLFLGSTIHIPHSHRHSPALFGTAPLTSVEESLALNANYWPKVLRRVGRPSSLISVFVCRHFHRLRRVDTQCYDPSTLFALSSD
ncbi:hypothetical protein M3J09_000460 [Ascochyta lentis]